MIGPPRRQHQPTAPNNRKPSPMNLPHPFDWPVDLAIWTALRFADLAVHINSNLLELGIWWTVAYWLAVAMLFDLGSWGIEASSRALRGNDIIEVRYAGWLGRFTAFLLRGIVRGRTWPPTFAVYVGYPGVVLLLAVGIMWRWLAVLPAVWLVNRLLAVRRARIMTLRRHVP